MKELSIVKVTLLGGIAFWVNMLSFAEQNLPLSSLVTDGCGQVSSTSGGGDDLAVLKPGQLRLSGNCDGCVYDFTQVQYYCMSQGNDCDGIVGWNESYRYARDKRIYQCGTPGTPGYGWFVECLYWQLLDCCNNGSTSLPPTDCTYPGAEGCTTR